MWTVEICEQEDDKPLKIRCVCEQEDDKPLKNKMCYVAITTSFSILLGSKKIRNLI
jgi:hypothetical protein